MIAYIDSEKFEIFSKTKKTLQRKNLPTEDNETASAFLV